MSRADVYNVLLRQPVLALERTFAPLAFKYPLPPTTPAV